MVRKFLYTGLLSCILGVQMLVTCSCSEENGQGGANSLQTVSLIPQPQSLVYGNTSVVLPSVVTISKDFAGISADLLKTTLANVCDDVEVKSNEQAFIQVINNSSLQTEEYKIAITADNIKLECSTSQGLLWGVQTLRQILLQSSVNAKGENMLPLLTLNDKPQKEWRGFHIDVARHAFTIDYLKKIVDCLSFYKINKLQLHLTDDQGWRIEIKKYPTLTSIGGWREFDEYDKRCIELSKTDSDYTIDSRFIRNNNEYGGFYSQEELKQLIDYATKLGIEVIPEIDMPGHFSAAIKAFPDLSCSGEAGWGEEFSYPICAGKVENYSFFKDILDEVMTLFPSSYIHIGADEVEKNNWRKCPRCQALIKEQGLMNVDGLQNYFVGEMAEYVKSKGKKVMAWDDAFNKDEPLDLLYTYWRDWMAEQPADITQHGLPLVFMEWGHFYLSATPSDEAMKALYNFSFEPQFSGIVQSQVKGFQACVWTEMIPNERKFGQHVFPALQAFAELAWGSQRDWERFVKRLPWHLQWLTHCGLHYRKPGFIQ